MVPSRRQISPSPFDPESSRSGLLSRIRETAWIAERKENLEEALNEAGALFSAVELYHGQFYRKNDEIIHDLARENNPSLHLLIVSALYGLVGLNKPISIYDLKTGKRLQGGLPRSSLPGGRPTGSTPPNRRL